MICMVARSAIGGKRSLMIEECICCAFVAASMLSHTIYYWLHCPGGEVRRETLRPVLFLKVVRAKTGRDTS